jgi:hypothetical protein
MLTQVPYPRSWKKLAKVITNIHIYEIIIFTIHVNYLPQFNGRRIITHILGLVYQTIQDLDYIINRLTFVG